MHSLRILVIALLAVLVISTVMASAQSAPAPQREWTVMVHMNGKNSLEPDALNNFHAMAGVGSTDRVAIVVELGRPKKHYTSAEGNWSGVYRFLVARGQTPRAASAVEGVPPGVKSDMGRPDTVANFVSWTKAKYPARHYMVIIWNHGQGYRLMFSRLVANMSVAERARFQPATAALNGKIGGFRAVSSDEDTRSILYNAEVEDALARNFTALDKLDLLGFDACLMAMIETAYAVDGNVRLMVGSEELEPGDGWQYRNWLGSLVADPTMTPEALGRAAVDSYGAHYGDSYYTTLSLLDLSKVREAATALTSFSDVLRAAGPGELQLIRAARDELLEYGNWDTPPSFLTVDLVSLLERYKSHTRDAVLEGKADAAIAAARSMVIANYASQRSQGALGQGFYGSKGLAIYYPRDAGTFRGDSFHQGYLKENTDRPVAFVRDEHWADLLYVLLGVR